MPECKKYKGQMVKNARRLIVSGKPVIRVTFVGAKGLPGKQIDVSPEEYEAQLMRFFVKGKEGASN